MKKAIYPGSFDPVTNGHLDIIERVARQFDEVIVCVMVNYRKQYVFSAEERCELIRQATAYMKNVRVDTASGLLVDYARSQGASAIVKGLRTAQDFEFEMQMAQTNKKLDDSIETFFLMTNHQYAFLSSSVIRELMEFNGDVSGLIPSCVEEALRIKYGKDS